MTSLRARLLFGIVAANVTALSALALVVVRDIDRRAEVEAQRRQSYRDQIVERATREFETILGELDFTELDSTRGDSTSFFKDVLERSHWSLVRDAFIVSAPKYVDEYPIRSKIELNPLGAPDEESELLRENARRDMALVYKDEKHITRNDVVVVPLYAGSDRSNLRNLRSAAFDVANSAGRLVSARSNIVASRRPTMRSPAYQRWLTRAFWLAPEWKSFASASDEALDPRDWNELRFEARRLQDELEQGERQRKPWGAAYIRVDVPKLPEPGSSIDVSVIALALGGATLLAIASLWLLLRRLVLEPLSRVSAAAVTVASGALETRLAPTGDTPEIDALIANFNQMTAELAESRGALERRVDEALGKLRDSEKRLVLNERLAAMGTLAAGIAHEINNPLGGTLNALATLKRRMTKVREQEADPATVRYLELIEGGLGRMRDVVERVLRFSRTRRAITPLARILDDSVWFVRHRVREMQATLHVEVAEDLAVDGDRAALGQVFLNLLVNALDSLTGEVRDVKVEGFAEGALAIVRVTDTGCGMSAEQSARAFEYFYTTKVTGTGLGLSIAHQIIAEHGGTIHLTSVPGQGTRFEVRLPLAGRNAAP